jgi:hypothetical protein
MRWRKLGIVFESGRHGELSDVLTRAPEFAQAPQALVHDDRVRVYFSTRARDETGGVVSHVAFADFDLTFERVLDVSRAWVLPPGKRGTFDEHGIFPFHVTRHAGAVLAFPCGWSRRRAVPVETAIGLARSEDGGRTFARAGDGPLFGPALAEPCLVGDPCVLVRGGTWHMWYIFGPRWIAGPTQPERVYKIAHATSGDGITWQRNGRPIVTDRLGPDECQALPTVFEHDGRFHMIFCYRDAVGFRTERARAYRLGHAWSADLATWTRDDDSLGVERGEAGEWDSDMLCYPHVVASGGRHVLLYNGNAFGRLGFGAAVLED